MVMNYLSKFTGLLICVLAAQISFVAVANEAAASNPSIRVATFNVSLNRPKEGQLPKDLADGDEQVRKVAKIIRTIRPDVILLNEFDYDHSGEALKLFREGYLEAPSSGGADPIVYEHSFMAEVNTGVPSGVDVDRNGKTGGAADGFGYGAFPGQYGMVILSKHPIVQDEIRTFRKLLWSALPRAAEPVDASMTKPWYPSDTWSKLRLSSKSHWDIPIKIGERVLHVLASHPTPPAFDGEEDRNGRRNHDEIRLWAEYLTNENCDWLVDDDGKAGGLKNDAAFVVLGDLNADPSDGGSFNQAIGQLLSHPRINASAPPSSLGAVEAAEAQGQANLKQEGDSRFDTADFSDRQVGNLRVDYVLPSANLRVLDGQVVWPRKNEPLFKEVQCSDHRMVWLDLNWK